MTIEKKNNWVPSKLTIAQQSRLKAHLTTKMHNVVWLGKMVKVMHNPKKVGEDVALWFPYVIKPGSVVTTIMEKEFKIIELGEPHEKPGLSDNDNVYMIAMPCVPEREMKPKGAIQKIIAAIENDAFHKTSAKSLTEIGHRVGLVIGLNTFYSMDSSHNEFFREYTALLSTALKVRELPVKIVPFFWSPWKTNKISFNIKHKKVTKELNGLRKKQKPIIFSKKLLLSVDNCYMLIKSYFMHRLSVLPKTQKTIGVLDTFLDISQIFGKDRKHPINSIIPYQQIRTTILHSSAFKKLSKLFAQNLPDSLQYVLSLDADFVSLKTDKLGLLTHYDNIVLNHYSQRNQFPSVMSTGYVAPTTETMGIISAGIELDRKIREAVAKTLPAAVYMPEPNFAFLLKSPDHLKLFSFMKGQRAVMSAESRQLIKSATKDKLIDPAEMTFVNIGAIQTMIDDEWRTGTVMEYTTLTQTSIFFQKVIKALRGLHQSYADSQIWANNIYSALGRKVTGYLENAVKPMKLMRNVFDPYEFVLDMAPQFGSYSKNNFVKALSFMEPFFTNMKLVFDYPKNVNTYAADFSESCKGTKKEKEFLKKLFETKAAIVFEVKELLEKAGYKKKEIRVICTLAIDTGAAITGFFISQVT